MNKHPLNLVVTLALSCITLSLSAQQDSSWLDGGALKLKKNSVQSISIRGEDLEKMPYTHLSDAIGAWLFGAYSNRESLIYVVDGNPVSDVNAYSVYDIEEVLYVQNAAFLSGTAGTQQQLILITTRKKAGGPSGFRFAAQLSPVTRDFRNLKDGSGIKSNTNLYHQYYAGFYKSFDKFSFGLSADFQRDVFPSPNTDSLHSISPDALKRWHFNGFLSYRPNDHNLITLRVNYSPENIDSLQLYQVPADTARLEVHQHQNLFTPSIRWQTNFLHGWTNELQGTWLTSPGKESYHTVETSPYLGQPGYPYFITQYNYNQAVQHLYIRDRLAYTVKAGNWQIDPSLNASYEHLKENYTSVSVGDLYRDPGDVTGGLNSSFYYNTFKNAVKEDLYILTPALHADFKEVLSLDGGLVANVSHSSVKGVKRIFPFASVSAELLKWKNADGPTSLRIFGSYAKRTSLTQYDYALSDLSTVNSFNVTMPGTPFFYGSSTTFLNSALPFPGSSFPSSFWVWETGARLSVWKERLQVSYNFERRNYTSLMVTTVANGPGGWQNYVSYPDLSSSSHFFRLMAKIGSMTKFQWHSGLNLAIMTTRFSKPAGDVIYPPIGDFNPGHPSWTGGWVNQVNIVHFVVGLAIQYHFAEILNATNNQIVTQTSTLNSFLLQNCWLAYRMALPKGRPLEVYLNSRNLYQNSKSDLTDRRRYIGIGGKLDL